MIAEAAWKAEIFISHETSKIKKKKKSPLCETMEIF